MDILPQFSRITTFVFDMDGVLTDGTVWVMPDGEWVRRMHIRDGYVLQLAIKRGYKVWMITGSSSTPVAQRLQKLGLTEVHQQIKDKATLLKQLMQNHGVAPEQVLYMGDDMPDLTAMQLVGLSTCPKDAARDILEMADYISPWKGGQGCVRDVIEKVMRIQGNWSEDISVAST
jgi:3-deoxy-D-manno-octulosonate 8-phosphate phosphatase (KDO 8-P phosphatase)